MLKKIKEDLELLQGLPLRLTQAYCKQAYAAASKALAAAEMPSSIDYVYSIFDLREKIKRAILHCSPEQVINNSEVLSPLEMLKDVEALIEEIISEPQQTNNEN